MTTMDRLYQKGLLSRKLVGKAFVYSPRVTREDFARRWVRDLWQSLIRAVGEPAVSYLVDAIREEDMKRFEELAREVERARQEEES
jgi:predicted transcriptional regulator